MVTCDVILYVCATPPVFLEYLFIILFNEVTREPTVGSLVREPTAAVTSIRHRLDRWRKCLWLVFTL